MDQRIEDVLKKYGVNTRIVSTSLDMAFASLNIEIASDSLLSFADLDSIAEDIRDSIPECTVNAYMRTDAGTLLGDKAAFIEVMRKNWAESAPALRPVIMSAVMEPEIKGDGIVIRARINPRYAGVARDTAGGAGFTENMLSRYGVAARIAAEADENVPEPAVKRGEVYRTPIKKTRKKKTVDEIIMGVEIPESRIIKQKELSEMDSVANVEGSLLSLEITERRSGGWIVSAVLTDRTESTPMKLFLKKEERKVADKLKKCKDEEKYLRVSGRYDRDDWLRRFCIYPKSINVIPLKQRKDDAEEKRVELHLHTQMSSMDALIPPDIAVKTAARWGHKAVAITDHGVVQAFPLAVSTAKKLQAKNVDIKVILGVEGYLRADCAAADRSLPTSAVGVSAVKGAGGTAIFELAAVKRAGDNIERFSMITQPGVPYKNGECEAFGLDERETADGESLSIAAKALIEFTQGCNTVIFGRELFEAVFIKYGRGDATRCVDVEALRHYLDRDRKDESIEAAAKELSSPLPCVRAMDRAEVTLHVFDEICRALDERGAELPLFDYAPADKSKRKRATNHIILLAKNRSGLKDLYRLVSFGHLDYFKKVPVIPKSLLYIYKKDIIVGSACEAGELFRAVLDGEPEETVERIASLYDYLEIQPTGNNAFLIREGRVEGVEGLQALNLRIVELGKKLNKPVAATGDVHFLEPDDSIMRAILMNAKEFKDAEQQAPLYFRTTNDMLAEFSYLGEEEARRVVIEAPNRIADMCESMPPFLDEKRTYAPTFERANEDLSEMAMARAHELYGDELPEIVAARMKKELKAIVGNGYASLYLVAQKLVQKSNKDGYLVGSRGSVGSSLVAHMAGITEVNALPPHYVCKKCRHSEFDVDREKYACGIDMEDKLCPVCGEPMQKLGYDIPFEVFLGFKGDKTPDIDLNFSGVYQPVAHKFTETMFGEGHAFRAGTISGVQDKTAYGYILKYKENTGVVFSKDEETRLAMGCAGVKRTTGQHPGGIVIVPKEHDILEFTPIQHPADKSDGNIITTHFDFHALDDRLVKLDILGHDDPTALRMLNDLTGLDPHDIPLDDPDTMALFHTQTPLGVDLQELGSDVGSVGIPEFGTSFVRQMLMDTRPTTMEELVRISGLSHGTDVWVGNAQDLVKEGVATLSSVICTRDDIMNYLIAKGCESSMAFKTMESVRKGKGLTTDMEKAMAAAAVPGWFVDSCKKIQYMFPRAHAAAYVMMAFRVAYYKVHYPKEFYAVYYTVRADAFDVTLAAGGTEKVLQNLKYLRRKSDKEEKDADLITILEVVYEMNLRGIELLPVDLYLSDAHEFRIENGAIRPPFSALPGVGDNAAEGVAAACRSGRRFTSVEEFRTVSRANSAVVEALKNAGCFTGVPETVQVTLFEME